jgi:hypothetical protein
VSGGALCVVGAVVMALAMPAFARHRASEIASDGPPDPLAVGPIGEDGLAEP